MNTVKNCGYIIFTSKWFEGDDRSTGSESFKITSRDGKVLYNQHLREVWGKAIKSKYINDRPKSVFNIYDLKCNPRRFHPFSTAFVDWFCREIPDYLRGRQSLLPVLILHPSNVSLHQNWRCGLPSDVHTEAQNNVTRTLEAHAMAKKIQRWFLSLK